ncbi:MAG: 26S protease regulatory subunit [Candidatus Diapherotrites archaeon]|nr:26S protease regulatory subunit [Candidatus Diapherotrites archaeon]
MVSQSMKPPEDLFGGEEISCDLCGRIIPPNERYFAFTLGLEYYSLNGDGAEVEPVDVFADKTFCLNCSKRNGTNRKFNALKKNAGPEVSVNGPSDPRFERLGVDGDGLGNIGVEVVPSKGLDDVVLTPNTRKGVELALAHVRNAGKLMADWGLGEKFSYGNALALSFVGLPGTGKTLCAEALAKEAGKKLLVANASQLLNCFVGGTEKRISALFERASKSDCVLFFDEADSLASTRVSVQLGNDRYANSETNVLLQELEKFRGIVVFSSNMAGNFDPAFERRIGLHVLFEFPGKRERVELFKKLVPKKMPLAKGVCFEELAKEKFSGGDIKNVIINAARLCVSNSKSKVSQAHFVEAVEIVKNNRKNSGFLLGAEPEAKFRRHCFVS